uniref:Uncharacterized protein n=1 Tax=viral metagenome TaxID=1070528 RepID=A0A6C0ANG6_9ZZZZ
MEPPPVRNKGPRTLRRLTEPEMLEINEHGLEIPSRNSKNFEPNLDKSALLVSTGTLAPKYNYRNKAKANQENTWEAYLKKRANAEARAKGNRSNRNTRKNKRNRNNRNNRNTRKGNLFGNFNIKNDPRITLGF